VGGVKYTVVDGRTGCLIPPADPEALAECLATLHANAGLRAALGRAGRARVLRHFTWSDVALAVEAVYEDVLAGVLSAPQVQYGSGAAFSSGAAAYGSGAGGYGSGQPAAGGAAAFASTPPPGGRRSSTSAGRSPDRGRARITKLDVHKRREPK